MVDKKSALVLRKAGFSYSEIASKLGCSKGWCAANLKGVEKGFNEKKVLGDNFRLAVILLLENALLEIKKLS